MNSNSETQEYYPLLVCKELRKVEEKGEKEEERERGASPSQGLGNFPYLTQQQVQIFKFVSFLYSC